MIAFATLLIGFSGLIGLSGCMIDPEQDKTSPSDDVNDSINDSTNDDSDTTNPNADADGDGVNASEDCDDTNPWVDADCDRTCTGNFEISSDADLAQIAGCSTIDGNVDVEGLTQTDLTGFNSLQEVTGSLWIMRNTNLQSVEGLNNLQQVGDDLLFSYNADLTSLDGLESLTNIDGTLSISNCAQLIYLTGLNALTAIHGSMMINDMPIANLDAFENLEAIGASIYISDCDNLTSLAGMTTTINSFGEDEIIGTYDEEGYTIASLFYVYSNAGLCQDRVDETTSLFQSIGWTGQENSWDNEGVCN